MYKYNCGDCREDIEFNRFMEGVNPDDYCPQCGNPLHDMMTLSDGTKRMYAHEINSKQCKETGEWVKEFLSK